MGLDIGAFKNVRKAENQYLDEDGDPVEGNGRRVCINDNFPGRYSEFEDCSVVLYDDYGHFYSRSYGTYNRWRNDLAKLAGYPLTEYEGYMGESRKGYAAGAWDCDSGPFWELINFSDCEGDIGPSICAKLAIDFANYQDKANATQDEDFITSYNNIRAAFDYASGNGIVSFH